MMWTSLTVILLLACLAIAGGWLYLGNKGIVVTRYTYEQDSVPERFDGFRIVQVSDLQSTYFGREQQNLRRAVEECRPDIIVFTGDLLDRNHTDYRAARTAMAKLTAVAPVYYVNGNHELALPEEDTSPFYDELRDLGVHVLFDRREVLERGEDRVVVGGLSEYTIYGAKAAAMGENFVPHRTDTAYDPGTICRGIEQILAGAGEEAFVILLAHEPQMIDGYSQPTHPGVDLVFAGHAHGGQIRLPFTDGLFAPGQGILPKLTSGVHVLDNTTMIISRGLGNSTFPLRLFNRPEVVVTELKRKRKLSEKTEKKYDFREES